MSNYTYEFFGSGSAILSIDPTEFTGMSVEAIKTELKCLAQSQVPELNFPDAQFDNAALEVYYASLQDRP